MKQLAVKSGYNSKKPPDHPWDCLHVTMCHSVRQFWKSLMTVVNWLRQFTACLCLGMIWGSLNRSRLLPLRKCLGFGRCSKTTAAQVMALHCMAWHGMFPCARTFLGKLWKRNCLKTHLASFTTLQCFYTNMRACRCWSHAALRVAWVLLMTIQIQAGRFQCVTTN